MSWEPFGDTMTSNIPVSEHLSDDIAPHSSYTSSPTQRSHVSAAPVAATNTQLAT